MACKTNKNKVIFEWISSVVEHHDLGAKQQVCRCAFFSNECPSVRILQTSSLGQQGQRDRRGGGVE